jgi:hypothetical protein
MRELDLGRTATRRRHDLARRSVGGRRNEAEDFWARAPSRSWTRCGPFGDALTAALGIVGVSERSLTASSEHGRVQHAHLDRVYNAVPAVTATVAASRSSAGTRATANAVSVADQTDVTFTAGANVVVGKYRFDSPDHTFLFTLSGSPLALEPELAAFSPDGTTCFVTLQENNAVVVLDFTLPVPAIRAVNGVLGLGSVDVPDADVTNGGANSPNAGLKDLLQREREPDGIVVATLGGVLCFVTADEGDTFGATPTDSSSSRFRGGRTVSVFRASDGVFLGDTGNRLDALVNATGRWAAFVEPGAGRAAAGASREPRARDVEGPDARRRRLERANALALVDVTDPRAPTVLEVVGIGGLGAAARQAPEGIKVFTAEGRTFVLAGHEVSGTVGLFEVR